MERKRKERDGEKEERESESEKDRSVRIPKRQPSIFFLTCSFIRRWWRSSDGADSPRTFLNVLLLHLYLLIILLHCILKQLGHKDFGLPLGTQKLPSRYL